MLCRRHITQEICTAGGSNGTADGSGNVVIPRENIGHHRPKHIEGGIVADPLFQLHIGGNFIDRHMPRPLNHDLDVSVPCPLGQSTQLDQLGDLPCVAGIINAAGTQCVTQADSHIIPI